ncbi:MAG TPA: CcmD family protein [Bacteroidia bacterium]|nr:CcmD family protein [Bacteroidia bacterium]HNT81051.1 CcmD family protein [Bacteroidia bacterium]
MNAFVKNKNTLSVFLVLILMLFTSIAQAQEESVTMADTMRSEGKIYVVVSVLCIVFAGIVFYLISLDRKIKKLETKSGLKK